MMATKVFISYRRDVSRYQARMIHAAFCHVIPRDHVFMDVDSIPPGANFRKILKDWVNQSEVLLALIGPGWIDASDPKTKGRRLDNPSDFVRIEIGEALARDIPVVPVLIDGAPLPDIGLLPDDLKELVDRQAEIVEYRTFDADVERLIRKLLTEDVAEAEAKKRRRERRAAKEEERRKRSEQFPPQPDRNSTEQISDEALEQSDAVNLTEAEPVGEPQQPVNRWLLLLMGAVAAFLGALAYEPLLKLPAPDRSLFVIVVLFGAVAGMLVPSCGPLGAVVGSWMVVVTFLVLGHIYLGLSETSWEVLGVFTALPMGFVWLAFWLHSLWARAWRG